MVDKVYKQNILLTGGAGFLGNEFVKHLVKKKYNVFIFDKKKYIGEKYANLENFILDVTSEKQIKKVYSQFKKRGISIDILINNAAIDSIPVNKKKNKLNTKQIKKEIDVSVIGSYLLINYFSTDMIKKNSGKIINIGSDLSVIAPSQSLYKGIFKNFTKPVSYSIVKHAMLGLTKYYASLLGQYNICVNLLSPGPIFRNHNKIFLNRLKKIIPLNRMANIDDILSALDFLIENKNKYYSGQNLVVDGGRTIV